MYRKTSINLGNLVLALSDAMDLANPSLTQHQQRTALIAWRMGQAAGFSSEKLQRVFWAALLHDIGAFSSKERMATSCSEESTEKHCIRGELLLKNVPWMKDAAKIIRFHHKTWKSWEEPIDNPLVLESQILFLSDHLESHLRRDVYILHQHEDLISKIRSLSGSSWHPQVVDLFLTISNAEAFWLDLVSPKLSCLLLNEGPFKKIVLSHSDIVTISELFRNIIDFRSRYTSTHSAGVAASASMLARIFGFTNTEIRLMEVAGNLHDIGKLAIPSEILDKPGKLTKEEMSVMRSHTYYTYLVISAIGGLEQIAEWAAYHHERLDGSGYPFRCTGSELSTGSRIMMVADIFTALAEDRPYRRGMPKEAIIRIMKEFSDHNLLDGKITHLLLENYDEVFSCVSEKQAVARSFYERQFASLR